MYVLISKVKYYVITMIWKSTTFDRHMEIKYEWYVRYAY